MLNNQLKRRFATLGKFVFANDLKGLDKVCATVISDIKAAGTYKQERVITSS